MLKIQASFVESDEMSIEAVLRTKLSSVGINNLYRLTSEELFDLLENYVLEQEYLQLKNMYWNRHSI